MDFSELDSICADTFGETVTLRRNGQDDVTITAIPVDRDPEGSAPGLLREYFVSAGPTIAEGDQLVLADGSTYKIGPMTVETTGARRFKVFRQY